MGAEKKQLLFISQHYFPEMVSTGLHMTELTKKISEIDSNYQISVFCANSGREEGNTDDAPIDLSAIKIYRVSNWGKQHGSYFQRFLFGISFMLKCLWFLIIKGRRFDNIFFTTNPPFIGIAPLVTGFFTRVPYNVIVYDVYPDIAVKLGVLKEKAAAQKIWNEVTSSILKKAAKIVVIGDDMKGIIASKLPQKHHHKITLIHNWADPDLIKTVNRSENRFIKANKLQSKKILMYAGTMGRTHNIELLLAVATKLRHRRDIAFVFNGGGIKAQLVKDYVAANSDCNVLYFPFQPLELLPDLLSAANLSFVSLNDEFTGLSVPSKTYGMMAAGVPILCIMHEESEIFRTVQQSNCGICFTNNTDSNEIANHILDVITDQQMLDLFSANGKKAFHEHYELGISAKKYLKILN